MGLPDLPPSPGRPRRRHRALPALRGGHADGGAVTSRRVYIDWNTDADIPTDAAFGVRLNIKSYRRLEQVGGCYGYKIPTYVLFGHEAPGAGYQYSESGLRAFLTDYSGPHIVALTNRNEWDVPPLAADQVRGENAWAHRVCREFGIPFATSSTLIQDWYGAVTGFGGPGQWPGLTDLYKPGEVDGEYVDLHLYSYGGADHLAAMLDQYKALGYTTPVIVGEFGTVFGPDIPVRQMFDAILPYKEVAIASLFAMEAGGSDPSQDYGIRGKPAEQEFYDYAGEHAGGDVTPTRPYVTPALKPPAKKTAVFWLPSGQTYNVYAGGQHQNNENSALEWLINHTDGNGGVVARSRAAGLDCYAIYPALELTGADKIKIPASIKIAADYAHQYPDTRALCISLHTDSGTTQHFGDFHLAGESAKLATRIDAELAKVHGKPAAFSLDQTGAGYYALGEGTDCPANLVLVLIEIAAHEQGVPWIEDHVDQLAQAVVDGVVAYIASSTPEPIDWQARATAAEAKVAAAQAALVTVQNSEAQLRADVAALAKVLA